MKGFSDEGERLSHHLCILILITGGGGGSPRREGEGESDFFTPHLSKFLSVVDRDF